MKWEAVSSLVQPAMNVDRTNKNEGFAVHQQELGLYKYLKRQEFGGCLI
jgi:hypothetical protein